jgi:hypothetical protein
MKVYQVQASTVDYSPKGYDADCWQAESWPFSSLEKAQAFCKKEAGVEIQVRKVTGVTANIWIAEFLDSAWHEISAFRIWEMEVDRGLD